LGNGPGANQTNAIQVGTNRDWIAVNCFASGSMALRSDGTLWAWGSIYSISPSGGSTSINLPMPTQVCQETNWVRLDFGLGFGFAAWTDSGDMWELSVGTGTPNAEVGIGSNGRLTISGSQPGKVALGVTSKAKFYTVRADGSLWESDAPLGTGLLAMGPPGATTWRRVDSRSDWVSVWGRAGTVLGLTADGTIWTWGRDWTRRPEVPFSVRWQVLQNHLKGLFGGGPPRMPPAAAAPFVEKPRPLMRLIYNGADGSAATNRSNQ